MPHGRPNLRSLLHFSHNQEGDHEVHDGHVVALENNNNTIFIFIIFNLWLWCIFGFGSIFALEK
jgi:hypothetical protein